MLTLLLHANFLLFSESHGILFSLSKKTTNTINKFKKVKEYNRFINSVSLMRHDKFNTSEKKRFKFIMGKTSLI